MHDPDRPVPFITNSSSAQIGGPDDYHGVESRGDVLVYSGDPLTEPVEVIGPVRLVAHVATSAADTDLTAKLVDVHPNGFAQRLCDGVLRLRYRCGFSREEPLTPGEVYEVSVAMWDTCLRLEPGHRLRLEVASSAFPKIDVNLGTGGDMVTETERRDRAQRAVAHRGQAVAAAAAHPARPAWPSARGQAAWAVRPTASGTSAAGRAAATGSR